MPFTAEDCKRLTGTDTPDYYSTPSDWSKCKNVIDRKDETSAIPCWHPHCDCMGSREVVKESFWANLWGKIFG